MDEQQTAHLVTWCSKDTDYSRGFQTYNTILTFLHRFTKEEVQEMLDRYTWPEILSLAEREVTQ